MNARAALEKLYDFALGKAEEFTDGIGREISEKYGKAVLERDGSIIKVSVNDPDAVKAEFGTEDFPPKPEFTEAIYNITKKL